MRESHAQAFWFFFDCAGYSHDPRKESPLAGRVRVALDSVLIEARGREAGLRFEWVMDPYMDSSEFSDERPAWPVWSCTCFAYEDNTVLASLGCIDFGRGKQPWGEPYRRIVECDLAYEALKG
jgi:hypothetical protein